MATTTFIDGETTIVADWANDVDAAVYTDVPANTTAIAALDTRVGTNETDITSITPVYSTVTLTLGDGTNDYVLDKALGYVTKIDKLVHIQGFMSWTGLGSAGSSILLLGDLPYAASTATNYRAAAVIGEAVGVNITAAESPLVGSLLNGSTDISLRLTQDNAVATPVLANTSSTTGYIEFGITYLTD